MKILHCGFVLAGWVTTLLAPNHAFSAPSASPAEMNHFFENSRRVQLPPSDPLAKAMVEFKQCAGFFLKNEANLNLVATARHCIGADADAWCSSHPAVEAVASNTSLTCKRRIAGDAAHDFVVFQFSDTVRDRSGDFELADFTLPNALPLQTLGFPTDPFNLGSLALTEHCWVTEDKTAKATALTFQHTCTAFGGNSGGPMFVAGSSIAVGLPDQYWAGNLGNDLRIGSSRGLRVSAFVRDFRKDLTTARIAIRAKLPSPLPANDRYLSEGVFRSSQIPECTFTLREIVYNSGESPLQFLLDLGGSKLCRGTLGFRCSGDTCRAADAQSTLHLSRGNRFRYSTADHPNTKIPFEISTH